MSIFKPVTLPCGLTLRNQLMLAPMTTQLSFYNGHITQDEMNYYANRSHDIGAVITGAANVQKIGKGWHGELGVYDDEFLPGLSKLAKHIQIGGAKAILQIFHAGRMTNSDILGGQIPVSASAIAAERPNAQVPRELSSDEVAQVIEDFKEATHRAILAGFDGVEIHGANTYLIQQFYSPHSNGREDKWGGSREKRFTFINELVDGVIDTVQRVAERPFIVGYRFSPEEFETPGLRMADTLYLVEQLAEKPLDYLHLSTNAYDRVSLETEYQETSILAYVSKALAGRLPLVGVGSVETLADVQEVLEYAPLVAVGRSLIHDPRWGYKVLNNLETTKLSSLGFDHQQFFKYGLFGFVQAFRLDK